MFRDPLRTFVQAFVTSVVKKATTKYTKDATKHTKKKYGGKIILSVIPESALYQVSDVVPLCYTRSLTPGIPKPESLTPIDHLRHRGL